MRPEFIDHVVNMDKLKCPYCTNSKFVSKFLKKASLRKVLKLIDKSPVEKCHRYAVHEVVNLVPWLVFEVGRGMLLPLIAQAFSAQRGDRKSVGAVWGNRVLQ